MTRPRVVHAFSAGGVVYRPPSAAPADAARAGASPAFEVVLVGHLPEEIWVLPKGTPQDGETPEQTALREVREETGIQPHIVGDLGSIQYWFTRRGVRYHKEVRHYLMEAVGGSVAEHDHEYAEARWFPIQEAITRLAHENEAGVVRRAVAALDARFDPRADN
jgi:8-oxo-dGTP pyrophosphatase MutT (NUDIX family)